jgi:hypothetical protein
MFKDMKTRTHLKPGQKGTKRLVEKFGDSLLCVRYRYDEKRGVRLKRQSLMLWHQFYLKLAVNSGSIFAKHFQRWRMTVRAERRLNPRQRWL